MVSNNNNKGKEPLEDETQDPKLKEEVKSEDEGEVEEDPREYPRATVASIGVVANPFKPKQGARMSTGGKVPRCFLAPRTSSPGINNPFHTLIHKHQIERIPEAELPNSWNIDRSNSAGKKSSKSDEKWGDNSKSWDSQSDKFMNRIEHNTELIRILTHKIDELKELVDKLIKNSPSPPKE